MEGEGQGAQAEESERGGFGNHDKLQVIEGQGVGVGRRAAGVQLDVELVGTSGYAKSSQGAAKGSEVERVMLETAGQGEVGAGADGAVKRAGEILAIPRLDLNAEAATIGCGVERQDVIAGVQAGIPG